MSVLFKLKFGEETRRLTFPELPSWEVLSSRLTTLYGISPDRDTLGVSYTDLDGDEITLNTDEELLDYYKTFHDLQPGQAFRLKVVDLASLRGGANLSPRVRLEHVGPLAFDADDDWQRLPSLPGLSEFYIGRKDVGHESPHAFVQVIESDTESDLKGHNADEDKESATSTIQPIPDKGKEREAMTFPSTVSLLDEEVEEKHPIHVMDRSNDEGLGSPLETKPASLGEDRSVKKAPSSTIDAATGPLEEDPPLPTIDSDSSSAPSLTEDIATFLSSLSTAVASNPELSETFRRIMQNTTSGSYWRAHRESLSQTVNNISQSMGTATEEFRRNSEADAARNISQTLGNLFQSLSTASQVPAARQTADTPTTAEAQGPNPPMSGTSPRFHAPWRHGRNRPFWGPPPPPPPFAGFPSGFPPASPRSPFGHPPHPPPLSAFNHTRQRSSGAEPSSTNEDSNNPSYPSAPPKGPPRFTGAAPAALSGEPSSSNTDKIWDPELRPSWLPAPPPIVVETQVFQGVHEVKPNPQELRAAVEAAKERYKAEKERYRKEKEEHRRRKDGRRDAVNMTPIGTTNLIPLSREVSEESAHPPFLERSISRSTTDARGPTPQIDTESIPRRSSARPGSEDMNSRVLVRIAKRLADMGFTEASHPELPGQIKAQLPRDRTVTKENEDDIVTTLLEDLLANSPKVITPRIPVASGSGVRENMATVPGGWQ